MNRSDDERRRQQGGSMIPLAGGSAARAASPPYGTPVTPTPTSRRRRSRPTTAVAIALGAVPPGGGGVEGEGGEELLLTATNDPALSGDGADPDELRLLEQIPRNLDLTAWDATFPPPDEPLSPHRPKSPQDSPPGGSSPAARRPVKKQKSFEATEEEKREIKSHLSLSSLSAEVGPISSKLKKKKKQDRSASALSATLAKTRTRRGGKKKKPTTSSTKPQKQQEQQQETKDQPQQQAKRRQQQQQKQREPKAIEVDFYNSPTLLSRLVLHQKYEQALTRLKRHPDEASVWVCARRKERVQRRRGERKRVRGASPEQQQLQQQQQQQHDAGGAAGGSPQPPPPPTYSIRQLPLHIACINLCRALDTKMKSTLNDLISKLVVSYPQACWECDHRGVLPIHEAVWNGATPETISMLLMGYPKSAKALDPRGRSPLELNRHGPQAEGSQHHRKQVEQVLRIDVSFWEQTRLEAKLRMKQGTLHWPSLQEEAEEGGGDISSGSVLASSQAQDESLATNQEVYEAEEAKKKEEAGRSKLSRVESEEILSIAWEQLEERAIAAEQILVEVNENNFTLSKRIENLTKSKLRLIDTLDSVRNSDLVQEAHALQIENRKLRHQTYGLEKLLLQAAIEVTDVRSRTKDHSTLTSGERPSLESVSSMPSLRKMMSEEVLLMSSVSDMGSVDSRLKLVEDNNELRRRYDELLTKYDELNATYHDQVEKLHKLEAAVNKALVMLNPEQDNEGETKEEENSSSQSRRSSVVHVHHGSTVSPLSGDSATLTTIEILEEGLGSSDHQQQQKQKQLLMRELQQQQGKLEQLMKLQKQNNQVYQRGPDDPTLIEYPPEDEHRRPKQKQQKRGGARDLVWSPHSGAADQLTEDLSDSLSGIFRRAMAEERQKQQDSNDVRQRSPTPFVVMSPLIRPMMMMQSPETHIDTSNSHEEAQVEAGEVESMGQIFRRAASAEWRQRQDGVDRQQLSSRVSSRQQRRRASPAVIMSPIFRPMNAGDSPDDEEELASTSKDLPVPALLFPDEQDDVDVGDDEEPSNDEVLIVGSDDFEPETFSI